MTIPDFCLGGMHPLTTLDYPGVVSAIVFTQGCNFHCPYCHNPQLIPAAGRGETLFDASGALAFLERRAGILDGLVISGGEPTLQKGLLEFCRAVRGMGYKIKLDTNGSRPDVIRGLLAENMLEYIAMDCKTAPRAYRPFFTAEQGIEENVLESALLLRSSGVRHEFRTVCVSPYVQKEHVDLFTAFTGKSSPWFLQRATITPAMRQKGMAPLSHDVMEEMAFLAKRSGRAATLRASSP